MKPECGPIVESGTLVVKSPAIVQYLCKCGNDYHCWTVTAYRATATFTDENGKYPEDARI